VDDRSGAEARAALRDAAQAERRTRAAGRWFPRYLLLMGVLAYALIVVVEVAFPSGAARFGATATWALAMVLLGLWADAHDVHPHRAGRRLVTATAIWFGAYLLVIGPLVRWQAGTSLGWWLVAAAALASPFLVGAWREWRRW
jgi:hypothetical protein